MTFTYLSPQLNKISHIKTNESKAYDSMTHYFHQQGFWGLLASIDVKQCESNLIRSESVIKDFAIRLCDLIQMKRFQDPTVVHFGEDERVAGYSLVQLIETSLISGHFANATNHAYVDIFSCKIFDPYQAADFIQKFFGGTSSTVNICFRK